MFVTTGKLIEPVMLIVPTKEQVLTVFIVVYVYTPGEVTTTLVAVIAPDGPSHWLAVLVFVEANVIVVLGDAQDNT